ncbi:MAG TPA: hypothetical protein VLK84_31015, partial [Longimicrobium sp.]|nr:hypothetical protein [Longimicrobium sp.]
SAFANQIENYFLPAGIAALDEYGIPLQVGSKLRPLLGDSSELDLSLEALKNIDFASLELSPFEREVVADALKYL